MKSEKKRENQIQRNNSQFCREKRPQLAVIYA